MHLGLSEKEAAVYVASLELGPSVVQDISHKSKVNRATTYVMIESLTTRGLMSTYVKGKRRYYAAETPERLKSILRLQKKEIEEKENELDSILPMLMALYNVEGAKPQIRYFEGLEGMASVREFSEKLEGDIQQIIPYDQVRQMKEFVDEQPMHFRKLAERKIAYQALLVMENPDFSLVPPLPNGEVRIIPASKFPIHAEITVQGNHILLFSHKSAILSVVIVSKEIAGAVRALFELGWEGASSYPSRKM